jgi:glycosyltransferase involved in cell wall biosynthesis
MTARVVPLLQQDRNVAEARGSERRRRGVLVVGVFTSAWRPYRGVCEDLASQLSASDMSVVTTSGKRGRVSRVADMLTTAWRRRRQYEIAQVDVYSGRAFLWAEAVCGLLKWLKKPYVLTLHGGNLPSFASEHPGRVRKLLDSAEAVTAPSSYLVENFRGIRPDVQLIPNAIFIERYPFRLREAVRPRLIWMRSFHEIYDPALAVAVLGELARDETNVTLTMVGPDKKDGSYPRARAAGVRLGIADRVRFVGGVANTEVPGWLCSGDIFLNTARVDNTPVSVVEAMACGLCVVSTNVGGIRSLLEHGRDALLVPGGDARAMAAAVRRLLCERGLAGVISLRGRQKAEERDWKHILPLWTRLLDAVLPGSAEMEEGR